MNTTPRIAGRAPRIQRTRTLIHAFAGCVVVLAGLVPGLASGVLAQIDEGPPVPLLFVHGFCSDSSTWTTLVEALQNPSYVADPDRYAGELVALYFDDTRVRRLDGRTSVPAANLYTLALTDNDQSTDRFDKVAVSNVSIRRHAYALARVVQKITEQEDVDQVDLVTHGMGGLVARAWLQSWAQTSTGSLFAYDGASVRSLVTIDTPHQGTPPEAWAIYGLLEAALGDFSDSAACAAPPSLNKSEMAPLGGDSIVATLNSLDVPEEIRALSIGARRIHPLAPATQPTVLSEGDGIVPMDSQLLTRVPGFDPCLPQNTNIAAAPFTFKNFESEPDPLFLHLQVLGDFGGSLKGAAVARQIDGFLDAPLQASRCSELLAEIPETIDIPDSTEAGATSMVIDFGPTSGTDGRSQLQRNTDDELCTADVRLTAADETVLSQQQIDADGIRTLDLGLLPAAPFSVALESTCSTDAVIRIDKSLAGNDASMTTCEADTRTLCLQNGRFKVQAVWRTKQGTTGFGFAKELTPDTGYFWFFDENNVEVVTKVLDAQSLNGAFWVFYGALSNTEYFLRVSDTHTGLTRVYYNPFDEFASLGDTSAFVTAAHDAAGADHVGTARLGATEQQVTIDWISPARAAEGVEITAKTTLTERSEPFALSTDDGTMELGLTYDTDVFGPDFEGVFAKRFDFTGATGVLGTVSACWTRDNMLSGGDLDFSIKVYAPNASDNGPGEELASVAASANEVPISSNGGREGANCQFYEVDVSGQNIALDRVLYIGASYRPFPYPTPTGFAGYLLGVDSSQLLEPGWFLEPGSWTAMHNSFFFKNLGYRRMMIRAESELEARYEISEGRLAVNEFFTLDASSSTGNPDSYAWLIDGTPIQGETVTLRFNEAGSVPIQLTVSRGSASDTLNGTLEILETGACVPTDTTLCLNNGRFAVDVQWTDFQGGSGSGRPVQVTRDTGYFWFFDPANIELVLKVLDARAINDAFWIYFGALSNVEYEITVRDTITGAAKLYRNPPNNFASVGDTEGLPG